ncbi:MAG: alginate lyase family protein [Myxococcales bacterium]|nr:alginate lyase family protein [Myxococcales bacterium]
MLDTLRLYWDTLSHLRHEQIVGQVWVRMKPIRRWFERLQRLEPEAYPGARLVDEEAWLAPPIGENTQEKILAGEWVFLQESRVIGWMPDWSASSASKLWQYNLHYFEWLWALDFESARPIVEDWIASIRKIPEHVAFEPYPTSLRLMNWCGYFFVRYRAQVDALPGFRAKLWRSLCEQAERLVQRLEYHLLGNHLFENAAALASLGGLFYGGHARRWRELGGLLLAREIPEQILADGMHFERSPMYHTRILYVMMLLRLLAEEETAMWVADYLPKMKDALRHLCHPDGQIALLNDSAFGIYHEPSALLQEKGPPLETSPSSNPVATSSRLLEEKVSSVGCWRLPSAGYYGSRTEDGSYLVCDAGPIGPDYLPGHAHGDLFSFELSLRGHRIIVDAGVHDYLRSEMRRYGRSTRAHNTVEIEGVDQSEFWGAFRVARRASIHDLLWKSDGEDFSLQAWHDGYLRLPQEARHERRFDWSHQGRLIIYDRITAQKPVSAVARLHLHPDCSILAQDATSASLDTPAGRVSIRFFGEGELLPPESEESWYSPHFGVALPNPVLCFRSFGASSSFYCIVE